MNLSLSSVNLARGTERCRPISRGRQRRKRGEENTPAKVSSSQSWSSRSGPGDPPAEWASRTTAGPRLVEIDALLAAPLPSPPLTNGLVPNEIVAWNDEFASDEDDDSPSWFELFNASEEPARLKGWGVSDDARQPYRWTFPTISMAPRAYLRVFASGKHRTNNPAALHTSFRIDPEGETLLLTRPDGALADLAPAMRSRRDVSLGRMPNGTGSWKFLAGATPARSNSPQKTYESLLRSSRVLARGGL
jgi:hypothetical protein